MAHASSADNPVQQSNALAEVYAQSLIELADEAQIEEVGDELRQIVELVAADPKLAELLYGRQITKDKRADSIDRIFKGRITDLTWRFLRVLNNKERLDVLPSISAAYQQMLKQRRGEVDVVVYSATPLTEAQRSDLAGRITGIAGGKPLITNRIDEKMIGGLKLRIGDKLLDASVARQLEKMKQTLIRKGREQARANANALIAAE